MTTASSLPPCNYEYRKISTQMRALLYSSPFLLYSSIFLVDFFYLQTNLIRKNLIFVADEAREVVSNHQSG
jgi:hypothetical protein